MRSVTVRLDDLRTMILNLGFVGENEHRKFNFDCKKMFGEYPSASVSLTVQPPAGECYPATVERDGDLVSWTVTDSDLIEAGNGELQLTFMVGDVKAKTCIGRTKVERSLGATGDIPTPIENWIEQAEEVISEAEDAAEAARDAAGHQPIIDDNGYWAVWDADAEEYVATEYKAQGTDGHDGVGIVSIEKTGTSGLVDTYTITFTSGNPVTYTVTNGRDADPAALIDDASTVQNRTWSAKKLDEEKSSLLTEINSKYTKPNTGIPASDLESGVIPSVPVQDVQANGVTILDAQGVANIPVAGSSNPGLVKINYLYGVGLYGNGAEGILAVSPASGSEVQVGTNERRPIVPSSQHQSVFYGLAKLAGADMASSSNPVGTFTDDALVKIQKMLGVYESPWELIREDTFTNATSATEAITVDGNGDPIELTDIVLMFETPKQDTVSAKTSPIVVYYNNNTNNIVTYVTAWTQNANDVANGCFVIVTKEHGGLVIAKAKQKSGSTLTETMKYGYQSGFAGTDQSIIFDSNFTISKIEIRGVTGTGHYKLYGKRKWN